MSKDSGDVTTINPIFSSIEENENVFKWDNYLIRNKNLSFIY